MTKFPKLAIAAAMLAASGAVLIAPAQAKKEDKAAANGGAPALKLSPAFLKVAQPAQTAVKGTDPVAAEPAVAAAEAAAGTDDEKYFAGVMRLQLEQMRLKAAPAGQADQSRLKAPLDALLVNPRTPPEQKAQFANVLGQLALQRNQYADAVRYLTQAKQLGYTDPQLPLMLAQAKINSGDVAGGSADFDVAIKAIEASGKPVPEEYYRYALAQTVKKGLRPQSVDWLKRWLSAYSSSKNWHDALYIYGLQQGSLATPDRGEIIDLFRLMRQNKALDAYGYEEYGDKAIKAGLPDEAKTVIAEGRANGKLTGNGNAAAIGADAAKAVASEGPLTALATRAKASATGSLAAQTADAYLGKGDYASAIPLYRTALAKGSVKTDDVNLHLGIALAMSGDKAGARTAFGTVTEPTHADIAQFWTVWLDHPATA